MPGQHNASSFGLTVRHLSFSPLLGVSAPTLAFAITFAPALALAQQPSASAPAGAPAAADVRTTSAQAAANPSQSTPTVAPDQAGAASTPSTPPVATPVKGKKVKKKKEKLPKLTPVSIAQGTLTVDGWTGKARLNYDIADLKFIYMWAPEVGTVVVSNVKFPLAKEEPKAFAGNMLTIDAGGHTLQLFSEKRLLKEKQPQSAWVYVDAAYRYPSPYPAMGYGATAQAPYAWPGAKNVQEAKGTVLVPPPLPKDLRPALANTPCVPAGPTAAGRPCPPVATQTSPTAATVATAPSTTTPSH